MLSPQPVKSSAVPQPPPLHSHQRSMDKKNLFWPAKGLPPPSLPNLTPVAPLNSRSERHHRFSHRVHDSRRLPSPFHSPSPSPHPLRTHPPSFARHIQASVRGENSTERSHSRPHAQSPSPLQSLARDQSISAKTFSDCNHASVDTLTATNFNGRTYVSETEPASWPLEDERVRPTAQNSELIVQAEADADLDFQRITRDLEEFKWEHGNAFIFDEYRQYDSSENVPKETAPMIKVEDSVCVKGVECYEYYDNECSQDARRNDQNGLLHSTRLHELHLSDLSMADSFCASFGRASDGKFAQNSKSEDPPYTHFVENIHESDAWSGTIDDKSHRFESQHHVSHGETSDSLYNSEEEPHPKPVSLYGTPPIRETEETAIPTIPAAAEPEDLDEDRNGAFLFRFLKPITKKDASFSSPRKGFLRSVLGNPPGDSFNDGFPKAGGSLEGLDAILSEFPGMHLGCACMAKRVARVEEAIKGMTAICQKK